MQIWFKRLTVTKLNWLHGNKLIVNYRQEEPSWNLMIYLTRQTKSVPASFFVLPPLRVLKKGTNREKGIDRHSEQTSWWKRRHSKGIANILHPFADLSVNSVTLLQPLSLPSPLFISHFTEHRAPWSKLGPLSVIHSHTQLENQSNTLNFSRFLLKIHRV